MSHTLISRRPLKVLEGARDALSAWVKGRPNAETIVCIDTLNTAVVTAASEAKHRKGKIRVGAFGINLNDNNNSIDVRTQGGVKSGAFAMPLFNEIKGGMDPFLAYYPYVLANGSSTQREAAATGVCLYL